MVDILTKIDNDIMKNLRKVYKAVADFARLPKDVIVNLSFVDEETIRRLNKETRNIDKVTDVLTYPYVDLKPNEPLDTAKYEQEIDPDDQKLTIGDIYICLNRAREQSVEYGHSLNREICFLFCHGMLHILGYDHEKKSDEILMTKVQREILDSLNITREERSFKCGFVTIVGETNAGKSTLINRLVGEKVAIVSPKSQTTRENIKGIYNDENTQIVFVDTPGYHKRRTKIDDAMSQQIADATEDTEILLVLIDAKKPLVEQYDKLKSKLSDDAKKILLINKIDETTYDKAYPKLLELSKVEMRYYPTDFYTDKNLREMCAEIVREKALYHLDDEIPHGIHVVVSSFVEDSDPIEIDAELYCEREPHKAIILGKGGSMIKAISTSARIDIERLLGKRVNLQIFVKVKPNWRNDVKELNEFGIDISE